MTKLYFILSVIGWAWLVLVAVFLIIRFTIGRRTKRGFEVIQARSGDVPARPHDAGAGTNGNGP